MSAPDGCANCGHARDEHNDQGDCLHYDFGGCICFNFVAEAEATPEMRARRLFGRMWHSTFTHNQAFVAGGRCEVQDCQTPAARRIMVDIWGSVIEYDCCPEHAERYHGKLMDDFPAARAVSPRASGELSHLEQRPALDGSTNK
jgi:hypothetical protein